MLDARSWPLSGAQGAHRKQAHFVVCQRCIALALSLTAITVPVSYWIPHRNGLDDAFQAKAREFLNK
jgi:hypothetical protein